MEKRAANLTAADRQVIVELVEQHAGVIENKKTDLITNKQKDAAWQLVAAQFNAIRQEHRTAQQLKQVIFLIQSCFCSAKFIIHLIHSLFRPLCAVANFQYFSASDSHMYSLGYVSCDFCAI